MQTQSTCQSILPVRRPSYLASRIEVIVTQLTNWEPQKRRFWALDRLLGLQKGKKTFSEVEIFQNSVLLL